ncbi:MAG: glutamine amidotransferase [Oscillospiraceae bacterium]|jgi:CobQ-like glutamine amidotransferase family enzyme|nr:glutamine amidotransferase [Oscillospiraceae bacterium]
MKLKICHLYPDVLNLYGDTGNIACLARRLAWRGLSCEVSQFKIGDTPDFSDFDLFFVGGGQDFEQEVLLESLNRGAARELISAIEDERVVLAICGGYQMLGQYYETYTGSQIDFIGALDLYTVGSEQRMIGNCMSRCTPDSSGAELVGFENHSGRTFLGANLAPLATVISGFGNNGQDKTEGARYKNVFGSYYHGPMLPKNPRFADFLLETALRRKYPDAELAPLEDELESAAHEYMSNRLSGR